MDAKQVQLVQRTFEHRVRPIAQEAGEMMYLRLFEMEPSLKPLFKGDIKRQGEMPSAVVSWSVKRKNKRRRCICKASRNGPGS